MNRTKEFKDGKDLLTYITEKSIEKAGRSLSKTEKILNISSSTLGRFLKDKKNDTLTLINLLTLAKYSGAVEKLTVLTDYIEKVGPIKKKNKPNLTINLKNADAAYIIMSTVFGDGTFRKRGRSYEIAYFNKEEDNIEKMKKKMQKVFGITPSTGKKEGGYHHIYVYSNLPAISFLGIGLIPGEKTLINQGIPKFIIEGTIQERKDATEAMITDEGSIEQHSQLSILLTVKAPELKKHKDTLNQIEGTMVKGVKGEILGKFIAIGKLEGYKEIQIKAKGKEIKVLEDEKEIMLKLLKEHGIILKENAIQIKTPGITIYSDHISVSKQLILTVEATKELHKILGGFQGFKELMYANRATVWRTISEKPINLNTEEIETLKNIGTQRIIKGEKCYIISVEKLPEKLKGYATPPDNILTLQKEYSEEAVEILMEGKPVKVRRMPSRIRGEIRLYQNKNKIFWTLIPALQKTIKEKWQRLKPFLQKELTEEEKEKVGT